MTSLIARGIPSRGDAASGGPSSVDRRSSASRASSSADSGGGEIGPGVVLDTQDALNHGLGELDGHDLTPVQQASGFMDCQFVQGHGAHQAKAEEARMQAASYQPCPSTALHSKWSSTTDGAFCRASSRERERATASWRRTFLVGTTVAIGGSDSSSSLCRISACTRTAES